MKRFLFGALAVAVLASTAWAGAPPAVGYRHQTDGRTIQAMTRQMAPSDSGVVGSVISLTSSSDDSVWLSVPAWAAYGNSFDAGCSLFVFSYTDSTTIGPWWVPAGASWSIPIWNWGVRIKGGGTGTAVPWWPANVQTGTDN